MIVRSWLAIALIFLLAMVGLVLFFCWLPSRSMLQYKSDQSGTIKEIFTVGTGQQALAELATGPSHGAWEFRLPGFSERRLILAQSLDLQPYNALHIPLHLKGEAIGKILVQCKLISHGGWIYQTCEEFSLEYGQQGLLKLELNPHSVNVIPVGHGRPWDGGAARAIDRIVLRVSSTRHFRGVLDVGTPTLILIPNSVLRQGETTSPSDVSPRSISLGKPGEKGGEMPLPKKQESAEAVWFPAHIIAKDIRVEHRSGITEIALRLNPEPPDPFDSEQCDLRVLLLNPNNGSDSSSGSFFRGSHKKGELLPPDLIARARPAFYDQSFLFDVGAHSSSEELKPVGLPCFRVRIQNKDLPSVARPLTPRSLPLTSAHSPRGEGSSIPVVVLLILNGRWLGTLPLSLESGQYVSEEREKSISELPALPPEWTSSGGESMCVLYRPRFEWTGMPWRNEAAWYTILGSSSHPLPVEGRKTPSHWSYSNLQPPTLDSSPLSSPLTPHPSPLTPALLGNAHRVELNVGKVGGTGSIRSGIVLAF